MAEAGLVVVRRETAPGCAGPLLSGCVSDAGCLLSTCGGSLVGEVWLGVHHVWLCYSRNALLPEPLKGDFGEKSFGSSNSRRMDVLCDYFQLKHFARRKIPLVASQLGAP